VSEREWTPVRASTLFLQAEVAWSEPRFARQCTLVNASVPTCTNEPPCELTSDGLVMKSDIDWISDRLLRGFCGAMGQLPNAFARKPLRESRIAHSEAPAVFDAVFGS
jgi:hypothetical protein